MASVNMKEDLFSVIARGDVTEMASLIDGGADIKQRHPEL